MPSPNYLMPRMWLSTGLLAGSWLLGVGCVQPANVLAWGITVATAVALMSGVAIRAPSVGKRLRR